MKLLSKIEKFIDILMSFSTLIGFCSTLYLVWLFINTPPQITISTTNVGAPGIPGYKVTSYVIQGVPFFWIFTSLVSLSAGHTYKTAKQLVFSISGREPVFNPHNTHLLLAPKTIKTPNSHGTTKKPQYFHLFFSAQGPKRLW